MIETRPAEEIQRAHDLLVGIIMDKRLSLHFRHIRTDMKTAADVLCWVLLHGYNKSFQSNLEMIEEAVRYCGVELFDSGQLNYPSNGNGEK